MKVCRTTRMPKPSGASKKKREMFQIAYDKALLTKQEENAKIQSLLGIRNSNRIYYVKNVMTDPRGFDLVVMSRYAQDETFSVDQRADGHIVVTTDSDEEGAMDAVTRLQNRALVLLEAFCK